MEQIPLLKRISFKIFATILGVAMLAIGVTAATYYGLSRNIMKENVAERNLQITRRAASEINLFMQESIDDLRSIAESISPVTELFTQDIILENMVTNYRQYRYFHLVDRAGNVLASSFIDNSTAEIDPDFVEDAFQQKNVRTSPVKLSPENLPFILVAQRIRLPLAEDAVLVGELNLRSIWDLVSDISFGESAQVMLVSQDNVLIAHPDPAKVMTRSEDTAVLHAVQEGIIENSSFTWTGEDGRRLLVAIARVGTFGEANDWFVIIQQLLADAYIPANTIIGYTVIITAILLFVGVTASFILARRMATPLSRLLDGTSFIRGGDLNYRIGIHTEDEIGRISRSFNSMVSDLQDWSDKLAQSEQQYRLLTENVSDLIFSIDGNGRILHVNSRAKSILGFDPDELKGYGAAKIIASNDREAFQHFWDDGRKEHRFEAKVLSKNGDYVILEVKIVRTGELAADMIYYGVASDITERKKAEAKLEKYQEQLRSLASQLSLAEASERKRIAGQIHDRVSSALALVRIKMGRLATRDLPKEEEQIVKETLPLMEDIIQDTRTLTSNVSPPLLYVLGLNAALEKLVEQFDDEYETRFTFSEELPHGSIETDLSILLFEVVKELLVNAVKHAKAQSVTVSMKDSDDFVTIAVIDDGVGFDPTELRSRMGINGGFGLFSIRERLQYMKGSIEVDSKKGTGTRINLVVPIGGQKKT